MSFFFIFEVSKVKFAGNLRRISEVSRPNERLGE